MRRLILAVTLVAAACVNASSSTDSSSPTSLTTTTSTTTTSTTAPAPPPGEPPEITRFTRFEAGQAYRASLPGAGTEFVLNFQLDGWQVGAIGATTGTFVHLQNSSPAPGVQVGVVAFMADGPADPIIEWFANHPDIPNGTTPPNAAMVGGLNAVTFDVQVLGQERTALPACGALVSFPGASEDLPDGELWTEEVLGCTWSRIWVVDVDGVSITMTGGAGLRSLDPQGMREISEFELFLDDFIHAITFCTEATPCDD